ncbi:MAG: DUF2334 domain-containing protein [Clostridium sp.]|nr:DUF2334 domain-containing protein [Clostridium sp.]
MKIAVRLDDIAPDMDWGRFLEFKTLLDRYQVKPLIGVVPDNRDENLIKTEKEEEKGEKESLPKEGGKPKDFWAYVKSLEKEGWTVAMHGFWHIYSTDKGGCFPLNNFSEFAGLPLERQRRMLAEGKELLREKGIETDIFMAPAHSYDKNTLKALKETGFRALTDGFGNRPYRYAGLDFYPISFKLSKTLRKKKGYSTMVVHTNTVSEKDLKQYESYFKRPGISWISFGEYLEQPKQKRGLPGRWLEFLMAKGKYFAGKLRESLRSHSVT